MRKFISSVVFSAVTLGGCHVKDEPVEPVLGDEPVCVCPDVVDSSAVAADVVSAPADDVAVAAEVAATPAAPVATPVVAPVAAPAAAPAPVAPVSVP